MFDLDPGKLLIIGVVALVVIPPKDLPSVMRQVGQTLGKLRRMAAEFQSQFMDAVREAELDEIRKDVAKIADSAKLDVDFDPVATVRNEIKGALGEGVSGDVALGAGGEASALAAEPPKSVSVSTEVKSPPLAADEAAAAAGIAPLAPAPNGEAPDSFPHPDSVAPLQTETAATLPSEAPPAAAPDSGARRS